MEVPKEFGMDAFQYRTKDEEGYVARLRAYEPLLVESWAGPDNVDDWATSFA